MSLHGSKAEDSQSILVGYVNNYMRSIGQIHSHDNDCVQIIRNYADTCLSHLRHIKNKCYRSLEYEVDSYNGLVQKLFELYSSNEEFIKENYCILDLSLSGSSVFSISNSLLCTFFINNQARILLNFINHLVDVLLANSELTVRLNDFISNKYSIEQQFTGEYIEYIEKYSLRILSNLHKHHVDLILNVTKYNISKYNISYIDYVLDVIDFPEDFNLALKTIKGTYTKNNIADMSEAIKFATYFIANNDNVLVMMHILSVSHDLCEIIKTPAYLVNVNEGDIQLIEESISMLELSIVCEDSEISFIYDDIDKVAKILALLSHAEQLKSHSGKFNDFINILNGITSKDLNAISVNLAACMLIQEAIYNCTIHSLNQMWLLKNDVGIDSLVLLLLSIVYVAYEMNEDDPVCDQLRIFRHMPEYDKADIHTVKCKAKEMVIATDLLLEMTKFEVFFKNEEPFQDVGPIFLCKPKFL